MYEFDSVGHISSQRNSIEKIEEAPELARFAIAVVALFELLVATLFGFYAASPWTDRFVVPFFKSRLADTSIFVIAMLAMIALVVSLLKGKRAAWWLSVIGSALFMSLGGFFIWSTFHPRDDFARSEGGFGVFLGVLLLFPACTTLGLLNLPKTRRYFFQTNSQM